MLYNYPLPCSCGSTPNLEKVQLSKDFPTLTFRFICDCGKFTFATGKEDCARELWNASILKDYGKRTTK